MNAAFVLNIARALEKIREYALYFLLFFLPISNALLEIGVYVFLVAWLVEKIFISRSLDLSAVFLFLCGAVFFTHLLSLLNSTELFLSIKALFFKTGSRLLLLIAVADSVREKRVAFNLAKIFLLSAFVVTMDGFFQYVTGYDLLRGHPAGVLDVRYRAGDQRSFYSFRSLRISATLPTANALGPYLVTAILLAIGLFFSNRKEMLRRRVYVGGVLMVLFLACLGLTFSRGAMVGLIVAMIWLSFYRNKKVMLGILLIFLSLGVFAGRGYFSRADGINPGDPTVSQRFVLWEATVKMAREHLWLGHGLNTFHRVFPRYKPVEITGNPYAHNSYLQMLSEVGLMGVAAFVALLAYVYRQGCQRFVLESRSLAAFLANASLSAVIGFLTNACFDNGFYSMALATLFWFLLGYLMAMRTIVERERGVMV